MEGIVGTYKGTDIEVFTPPENAVIALRIENYKYSIIELRSVFEQVKSHFPNNAVVLIPSDIAVQELSIMQLIQLKDMISKLIGDRSNE